MRTDKCKKCSEKFEVVEIGGGQPYKPDNADIECPCCHHKTSEKTTGYFITKKLSRS